MAARAGQKWKITVGWLWGGNLLCQLFTFCGLLKGKMGLFKIYIYIQSDTLP